MKPAIETARDVVIRMEGMVKRFPGVLANDHINFELRKGEVHALLGENGAGKTTLMNILYGIHQPDEGTIYVRGQRVAIKSPKDAINLGIGMVHQNFKLVDSHTVLENILLGLRKPRFLLRMDEVEGKVLELSGRYGLKVDPRAKIWQLSMGERQRVEILKVLFRGADILILDEPTSVLTPTETRELFEVLRQMVAEGRSVIFITHKLDEVMAVSDRVTVLRAGRVAGVLETKSTDKAELATLMVGRKVVLSLSKAESQAGRAVLEVKALHVIGDRGLPALRGVSLTVRSGEIVGIAGIAGNGQRELAEAIAGVRPITSGSVILDGIDVTNLPPREILEFGVAYIPEDRLGVAALPGLTVEENIVLRSYRRAPFSKGPFLDLRKIGENAQKLTREFRVVTPSVKTPVRALSGGNLQRLILARELSSNPKLIVAVYPTRGLDVGATEYIRNLLLEQKASGVAILLISEDLEEILTLSDRIAVMYRGEVVGLMDARDASVEEVGLMMGGSLRRPVEAR